MLKKIFAVIFPFSKKDRGVRAKELRAHISPHVIKYLENNALEMMSDNGQALVVKAIITHASGKTPSKSSCISAFLVMRHPENGILCRYI